MTRQRLEEIAQRKGRNMGFQTVRILISPEERDALVAMAQKWMDAAERFPKTLEQMTGKP